MQFNELAWMLGLGATIVRAQGEEAPSLGELNHTDTERSKRAKYWLHHRWGIIDELDVEHVITTLQGHVATADYYAQQEINEQSCQNITPFSLITTQDESRRTLSTYHVVNHTTKLAGIAYMSFLAGLITEAELFYYVRPTAARLCSYIRSWEAFHNTLINGLQVVDEATDEDIAHTKKTIDTMTDYFSDIAWPIGDESVPTGGGIWPQVTSEEMVDPFADIHNKSFLQCLQLLESEQLQTGGKTTHYASPISSGDLSSLRATFGELPEALTQLLKWHNGQHIPSNSHSRTNIVMHPSYDLPLLSSEAIVSLADEAIRIHDSTLVPLYYSAPTIHYIAIGLSGALAGQLFLMPPVTSPRPHHIIRQLAPSLEHWLQQCLYSQRTLRLETKAIKPEDAHISESQQYKLALCAVVTEILGGAHTAIEMLNPVVGLATALSWLSSKCGISTAHEMQQVLNALKQRIDDANQQTSQLAFNCTKLVTIARLGSCLRWLTKYRAWTIISQAAQIVQRRFASWSEYATAYQEAVAKTYPLSDKHQTNEERLAWQSSATIRMSTDQFIEKLLSPSGIWSTISWVTNLNDTGPPITAPNRVIQVRSNQSNQDHLNDLIQKASPGDVFVLEPGQYGPITPRVSIALIGKIGVNERAILQATESRTAVAQSPATLLLDNVDIVSNQSQGIEFQRGTLFCRNTNFSVTQGQVFMPLDQCQAYFNHSAIRCQGLLLHGGSFVLEASTIQSAETNIGIAITGGTHTFANCELNLSEKNTIIAEGMRCNLKLTKCELIGQNQDLLVIKNDAFLEAIDCDFSGGSIGVQIINAKMTGHNLCFGLRRNQHDHQNLGAVLISNGAIATIDNIQVEGGDTRPIKFTEDEAVSGNNRLKAALTVTNGSSLYAKNVIISQRDSFGIVVENHSKCHIREGQVMSGTKALCTTNQAVVIVNHLTFLGHQALYCSQSQVLIVESNLKGQSPGWTEPVELLGLQPNVYQLRLTSPITTWLWRLTGLANERNIEVKYIEDQIVQLTAPIDCDLGPLLVERLKYFEAVEQKTKACVEAQGANAQIWAVRSKVTAQSSPALAASDEAYVRMIRAEVIGTPLFAKTSGGLIEVTQSALNGVPNRDVFSEECIRAKELSDASDIVSPSLAIETEFGPMGTRGSSLKFEDAQQEPNAVSSAKDTISAIAECFGIQALATQPATASTLITVKKLSEANLILKTFERIRQDEREYALLQLWEENSKQH